MTTPVVEYLNIGFVILLSCRAASKDISRFLEDDLGTASFGDSYDHKGG